jgi:putative mRNA 3-end processing factor
MSSEPLVSIDENGLYCQPGDFHIDPWGAVKRAIITHAHADHARTGSQQYLTAKSGQQVLRVRLGADAAIEGVEYGQCVPLNGVRVSLHPAGHILGSAQVRIEHRGQVCVVSGDYKTTASATVEPFESMRCHHFVSECTFGLPIYRWPTESEAFEQIHDWWRGEQGRGRTCVLVAYSLGKAQRILAGLDSSIGPILAHGAVLRWLPAYRIAGVTLPEVGYAGLDQARSSRGKALVVAPPSAIGTSWIKRFGPVSLAMASGWMQVRGMRRRKGLDRGIVLSDHADWRGLNEAIAATGAERVWLTHGSTAPMIRWLRERGMDAGALATPYSGEADEPDPAGVLDPANTVPQVSAKAP